MRSFRVILLVALVLTLSAGPALAGSIFITGHDPVWHSQFGSNAAGAKNLAETGIDYARNGDTKKFLFIESISTSVPGGNARTASFLGTNLKYAGQYDVMDGAALGSLADFRATLNSYSAIVVASDHGGMLTASELSFLNSHSADVIDYLNAGGGLFAGAESNAKGLIGGNQRFGFLPFLVASSDFQAAETGNTVTPFGASLGIVANDVNGNFSHNFFSPGSGMTAVDWFNGDSQKILTLATRSTVSSGGVVPEPGSWVLMLGGMLGAWFFRRRRT